MRIFGWLFESAIGLAFFALLVVSTPSWFYFEFKAAQGGHVGAFLLSLVLPPIGVVGGILLWFGAIWHLEAASGSELGRMLMQQRSTAVMVPLLVRRCGWTELDSEAASKVEAYASLHLRQGFHFDDGDLAGGDKYAGEAAAQTECGDQGAQATLKAWSDNARSIRFPPEEK